MFDNHRQDILLQEYRAVAVLAQEMQLVQLHALTPYKDGNMWCYLLGEDIQSGIAGFGASPYLAALDFNKQFYKQIQGEKS